MGVVSAVGKFEVPVTSHFGFHSLLLAVGGFPPKDSLFFFLTSDFKGIDGRRCQSIFMNSRSQLRKFAMKIKITSLEQGRT